MAKYHPLTNSTFIELPEKIYKKRAILNIKNKNDNIAHKYPIAIDKHANRVSNYVPHEHKINLGNIECAIPLNKIAKIEELNDIHVNVFGFEDEVFPLYVSEREDEDCINLLLISNGDNYHYCLIRSFSRLLGDLTKYEGAGLAIIVSTVCIDFLVKIY